MSKVFLDTNIVLDILDSKRKNHDFAKQLLVKIVFEEYQAVISEDMLSTIYYIIRDKHAVLEFFKVIQTDWEVVPFGEKTISTAIELCLKVPEQDFEDTLQCVCAKNNGCELLISRDNSFVDCGILVMSLDEFVN